tara:strand:- start:1941 stop:2141 length:201 start_codon:yes stop_codon:yes gene_type:complete
MIAILYFLQLSATRIVSMATTNEKEARRHPEIHILFVQETKISAGLATPIVTCGSLVACIQFSSFA